MPNLPSPKFSHMASLGVPFPQSCSPQVLEWTLFHWFGAASPAFPTCWPWEHFRLHSSNDVLWYRLQWLGEGDKVVVYPFTVELGSTAQSRWPEMRGHNANITLPLWNGTTHPVVGAGSQGKLERSFCFMLHNEKGHGLMWLIFRMWIHPKVRLFSFRIF